MKLSIEECSLSPCLNVKERRNADVFTDFESEGEVLGRVLLAQSRVGDPIGMIAMENGAEGETIAPRSVKIGDVDACEKH